MLTATLAATAITNLYNDYEESQQAEMTGRLLPDNDDRTEWYGYGTWCGLKCRATYYTTPEDQQEVVDNGGDWGAIDWYDRIEEINLLDEDDQPIISVRK